MYIKSQKGITAVDIAISLIIITIFIAVIANLIVNINLNAENMERKSIATTYAIQEIEKIKAKGYIEDYNDKGTQKEEEITQSTDNIKNGYAKKVSIKDYVLIKNDNSKQKNLVKEIAVEISYKLNNKEQNVKLSTYITK